MKSDSLTPTERLDRERGRRHKENFEILVRQLNHQHMSYRIRAAEALGNTGDLRAVRHLIDSINPDNDPEYLYVAMLSLGRLGSVEAVPIILTYLGSEEKWIRLGAVKALGMIKDQSAALHFLHLLNDKCGDVRASAAESFSLLDCTEAIEFIVPLLSDEDFRARESARNAIKHLKKIEKLE